MSGVSRVELRVIQKELESQRFRPVYYFFGSERLKIREMVKRLESRVFSEIERNEFNFESVSATSKTASEVLDSTETLGLFGGGFKLTIIQNWDEAKSPEGFDAWLERFEQKAEGGGPKKLSELDSIIVFVGSKLDSRKKTTKKLFDSEISVSEAEPVMEADRGRWIESLARSEKVSLTDSEYEALHGLDPWSLEILSQELKKMALAGDQRNDLLAAESADAKPEWFLEAFFAKKPLIARTHLLSWSLNPEDAIPFVGLMAWTIRQVKLSHRGAPTKLRRCAEYARLWSLSDLDRAEHALFRLDAKMKSSSQLALGKWIDFLDESFV